MNVGFKLANRYRITGADRLNTRLPVFPAFDEVRGVEVEVKTIGSAMLPSSALWADRLAAEFRRAKLLDHGCIRVIHDFGMAEDVPFLVMEWVAGSTLSDFLRSQPDGLPKFDFCDLAWQTASALEHVHARGLLLGEISLLGAVIGPGCTLKLADLSGLCERVNEVPVELLSCTADDLIERAGALRRAGSSHFPNGRPGWKKNRAVEELIVPYADFTKHFTRPARSEAADLYALGRFLYAMLAGRTVIPAWGDLNAGHARALSPPRGGRDWRPLVAGLLDVNATTSESASDIRLHLEEFLTTGLSRTIPAPAIVREKESLLDCPFPLST